MGWLRRGRHVCAQVTDGEVRAVIAAAQARAELDRVVSMGPMIESVTGDLAKIRERNHFAERIRASMLAVEKDA